MASVKISLGIVTRGEILIETMMCVIRALENVGSKNGNQIALNFQKGTYIHDLRNRCFKEAVDSGADYLMFVDTDVGFAPDSILKLLAWKKDIIGANYNMKGLPLVGTVKFMDAKGQIDKKTEHNVPSDKPVEVYSVASGFMLIRLKAVKNLSNPFNFGENPDGSMIGEDVNFCRRAREELGVKTWCDPQIKIGHIGEYLY